MKDNYVVAYFALDQKEKEVKMENKTDHLALPEDNDSLYDDVPMEAEEAIKEVGKALLRYHFHITEFDEFQVSLEAPLPGNVDVTMEFLADDISGNLVLSCYHKLIRCNPAEAKTYSEACSLLNTVVPVGFFGLRPLDDSTWMVVAFTQTANYGSCLFTDQTAAQMIEAAQAVMTAHYVNLYALSKGVIDITQFEEIYRSLPRALLT